MKLDVYDFDDTIYDGDSTANFYLYCLKNKPSLVRYLPIQIWYFIKYKLKLVSKENFKEKFYMFFNGINNIDEYIINEKEIDITEKKGWGDNAPKYIKEFLDKYNYSIEVPNFNNLGFWFRPKVIIELQIIKNEILKIENKDIRDIFLIAFSETIRLVSNKRNGEFKMYR